MFFGLFLILFIVSISSGEDQCISNAVLYRPAISDKCNNLVLDKMTLVRSMVFSIRKLYWGFEKILWGKMFCKKKIGKENFIKQNFAKNKWEKTFSTNKMMDCLYFSVDEIVLMPLPHVSINVPYLIKYVYLAVWK